jgi:hypothetical protein
MGRAIPAQINISYCNGVQEDKVLGEKRLL